MHSAGGPEEGASSSPRGEVEGEVAPEEQDSCRRMGDSKGVPGRGKSQVRDVGRNTWDCERFNRWGVEEVRLGRQGYGSMMKSLVRFAE